MALRSMYGPYRVPMGLWGSYMVPVALRGGSSIVPIGIWVLCRAHGRRMWLWGSPYGSYRAPIQTLSGLRVPIWTL